MDLEDFPINEHNRFFLNYLLLQLYTLDLKHIDFLSKVISKLLCL